MDVPEFFLAELDRKDVRAREVIWVCRTWQHARRYGGEGRGHPYQEGFGPHALILATDGEQPETGYLVLANASVLDPEVVRQFIGYRQEQMTFTGRSVASELRQLGCGVE